MTLDNLVEADILATCNALGSEIDGEYHKGSDCIECLKDILRYLKRDSENHSVLRFLGSIRLLQTDLLPLLKKDHNDSEIFDFTLRILVSLTNPALLLYKEDIPEDKICRNEYLQIVSFLQSYKKAFIDTDVWKVLYEHLKDILKLRGLERSSDENLIIERIIILVRNVLHVPPDESVLKQTDDDMSIHDKVLMCLHASNIYVLLLYMCANEEEHQYCLHLLEISFLMLREHTAEVLAISNETRTEAEKQKDLDILLAARQREQKLKLQKMQSLSKSRFNGVYCVKNVKSLSNNDLIAHKFISDLSDVNFDLNKRARCRPKNRARARDIDNTRQSTLNVRLFLKNFCLEFLKSYNKLMVSVKRALVRKVSEEHDETYYFWAVCYFMRFNRLSNFEPAFVSETVSTQTFHHIQTEITNFQEMMLTDKKKQFFWAKRMQSGVSAYKELLETLRKMERSNNVEVRDCADALISHIFYVVEYRELLLSLITHYDEVKFPISYLAELVESTQLFLKMLENHSKKHSEIIVQKKQKKLRKKKKKKTVADNEPLNEEELLESQWNVVSDELFAIILGNQIVPEVSPFDGASDLTFDEQKVEAVFKIRESIIANKPIEAIGLLRAARTLWPEGDTFGAADIEPESEIKILKDIHFSNLTKVDKAPPLETEDISEDDEEMESLPTVAERQLDLEEVYRKYASHKVVMPCSLLLANYRINKPETNVCLIKLLHRIAWNCKMHALFFQSTIFLTFQKIFHDPDSTDDPVIKEFYRFAKFIVQKFFSIAEKNNKIFVELLFWKGTKEAYEIEEGYGADEHKRKGWTEDDEEELKYLFEENKDVCIEGQDVADIILANFNKNRTKPQVILALKRLGLIKSVKDLKPEKRTEWIESEIVDLQHLFEEFKDSSNIIGNILEKLSIKRSRKAVVDKLLQLNLILDRKEVRKKTSTKKKSQFRNIGDENSQDENSDDNEDEVNNNSDEDEINFFKSLRAEINSSVPESTDKQTSSVIENKKPTEIWDEQEVMELIQIFNEHSDSVNILEIFQNALTTKRQNKDVIKKLLELGLIKHKNEVYKNKSVKTTKGRRLDVAKFRDLELGDKSSDTDNSINESSSASVKVTKKRKHRILSDDSSEEHMSLNNLISEKSNTPKILLKKNLPEISKKKRQSKIWEEQEVMELTELFHAKNGSNNIMDDILNGLTVKRPKQAVTEKLLELALIKDKKEVRKKRESKNKKQLNPLNQDLSDAENSQNSKNTFSNKMLKKQSLADSSDDDTPLSEAFRGKANLSLIDKKNKAKKVKVWEEQEIMEITRLFHENQESNDIVNVISDSLRQKRPKSAIIEKLLELGLIKDKKEVCKKRESNSKKANDSKILLKNSQLSVELQQNTTVSDIVDTPNDVLSLKKNRRLRILSDSSDDESNTSNPLLEDIGSKAVSDNSRLQNYRREIATIDNSSDDDMMKLNVNVEGDANSILSDDSKRNSQNMQPQSGKRKRVVISSDESNDDDVEKTGLAIQDKSQIQHSSKPKKKLHVLDDSDDSA